jgi:hypothetical protein
MDFEETYARLTDDELLMIAAGRHADLVPPAALALDSEMARRGLSYESAHARKKQVARRKAQQFRKHRPSRTSSKYFVANANLWLLLPLILGAVFLVIYLDIFHLVREEWEFPILAVSMGIVIAITMVQSWVKETVSFWISLIASCLVQLPIAYWISVHWAPRTRGELKGGAFLVIGIGYAVGAALFLLLQKLKPRKELD